MAQNGPGMWSGWSCNQYCTDEVMQNVREIGFMPKQAMPYCYFPVRYRVMMFWRGPTHPLARVPEGHADSPPVPQHRGRFRDVMRTAGHQGMPKRPEGVWGSKRCGCLGGRKTLVKTGSIQPDLGQHQASFHTSMSTPSPVFAVLHDYEPFVLYRPHRSLKVKGTVGKW